MKRIFLLLLVLLVVPDLVAQSGPPDRTDIEAAQEILRASYPEYGSAKVVIVQDGTLDEPSRFRFSIELHDVQKDMRKSDAACATQLLHAELAFRLPVHLPNTMLISVPSLQERTSRFQKSVSYQQLSVTQRAEKMRVYGAKFPSDRKEEFVKAAPIKVLEDVFGPFDVTSVEYENGNDSGSDEDQWSVKIRTKHKGRELHFNLIYEPFEGKLIGIAFLPS